MWIQSSWISQTFIWVFVLIVFPLSHLITQGHCTTFGNTKESSVIAILKFLSQCCRIAEIYKKTSACPSKYFPQNHNLANVTCWWLICFLATVRLTNRGLRWSNVEANWSNVEMFQSWGSNWSNVENWSNVWSNVEILQWSNVEAVIGPMSRPSNVEILLWSNVEMVQCRGSNGPIEVLGGLM